MIKPQRRIEKHLYVAPSGVPGASLGLYAILAIKRKTRIARVWEGNLIGAIKAAEIIESQDDELLFELEPGVLYADARDCPVDADPHDLASYAQDHRPLPYRARNAYYETKYYNDLSGHHELWIVASRSIAPGDEILVEKKRAPRRLSMLAEKKEVVSDDFESVNKRRRLDPASQSLSIDSLCNPISSSTPPSSQHRTNE